MATFVNSYPNLDVNFELQESDEFAAGTPIVLKVSLSREVEDDEELDDQVVVAPLYPGKKMVNWWLVIGEPSTRQLLAIRKVTVRKDLTVPLEFTLPKGDHKLKLYVICDSYNGADHDINLDTLSVAEGADSDSDEESGSDDEMQE